MAGPLAALIGPMLQSMTGAVAAKTAAAGAAKVAATEAAGAVAAKTAMSGAVARTAAGAVNPIKAGLLPKTPFSVLENPSTALSAKDLTRTPAGGGGPLPVGTRLPVPPVRNGGVAAQARAAQAAGQPQSPPVQSPPAQSPAASQPKGPVQTAADRFRAWREARAANRAEARSLQTPVARQIKGLTLPERAQRLEEAGRLLNPAAVTRQTGIEKPSQRDIVQTSERDEERQRQKRLAELNKSFEGLGKPIAAVQKGLMILGAGGVVAGGLIGIAKAMSAFSRGIVASNEGLRRFDPAIAASVAQMERQDVILQARTARATSGTATALNNQQMALREDKQGLAEAWKTARNTAALSTTLLERISVTMARQMGWIQGIERSAKAAETVIKFIASKFGAGGRNRENLPYEDFLENIAENNWRKPRDFDKLAGNEGDR